MFFGIINENFNRYICIQQKRNNEEETKTNR